MEKSEIYHILANHLFEAHRKYGSYGDGRILLIFADSIEEAEAKAEEVFDTGFTAVNRISPTDDPQVFEV